MKRTIYCKGFAKDGSVTLDHLLEFFKQYGPYDTVLVCIWAREGHLIPNFAIIMSPSTVLHILLLHYLLFLLSTC